MKKIIGLLSLTLLMFACQKEDIRPNVSSNRMEAQQCGTADNESNDGGTISTGTNPNTDPGTTDPEGGTITDPLRKKDKRD